MLYGLNKARIIIRALSVLASGLLFLIIPACHMSPEWRHAQAHRLIDERLYETVILNTGAFDLFTVQPVDIEGKPRILTVVIEGDGFAWVDRHTPSSDPTPVDPTGLRIVNTLTVPAVYVARPCQYVMNDYCHELYWTDRRFDESVIKSYQIALDRLQAKYGNEEFRIIGYSGGAYIAAVLAAQRRNVRQVTTIAGVLDPELWTASHNVAPIEGPMNRRSLLIASKDKKFTHWCGGEDRIVPCHHAQAFMAIARELKLNNHTLNVVDDADHATLSSFVRL